MEIAWNSMMAMLGPFVHDGVKTMLTRAYNDNPAAMIPVLKKVGLEAFFEAGMRAETGTVLKRPLGSSVVHSEWKKILLNPRQLFQLPTETIDEISMKTVIGKNAKKPLTLEIPILIAAMSNGGSLNENMKIALAAGASAVGTATNTGETSLVQSERNAAKFLIGQYNRGAWLTSPEQLASLDAIEVQLGQGAWGGASQDIVPYDQLTDYQKKIWNLKQGEDSVLHSRMPGINSTDDIIDLLNRLKQEYSVPIGVKIAASHFIERELDIITKTNVDYIVIDGSEGGTTDSCPTLEDDVGLPTLFALSRTVAKLEETNTREKYDLIITGGLTTPGHFLKAIALGADAVYIGTIAVIAALQTQINKAIPETVPPQIAMYNGKYRDKLNCSEAAHHLANFLRSCVLEMKLALQVTGKKSVHELSREDLVCVDESLAKTIRVDYAGNPPNGYSGSTAARKKELAYTHG